MSNLNKTPFNAENQRSISHLHLHLKRRFETWDIGYWPCSYNVKKKTVWKHFEKVEFEIHNTYVYCEVLEWKKVDSTLLKIRCTAHWNGYMREHTRVSSETFRYSLSCFKCEGTLKNIPTILFFQTDIHVMRGLINYLSSLLNLILWRISNWRYGHYTDQMSHLQSFPTWFVLKAHQGYFSFLFYCYIGSLSKINYE